MTAHIHVSWLDPSKTRKMTIVGSRKMLVYDDVSDDKIAVIDKGIDRVPKVGERMDYDYFNNYQLLHRTGDILVTTHSFQRTSPGGGGSFPRMRANGQTPLSGPKHARARSLGV